MFGVSKLLLKFNIYLKNHDIKFSPDGPLFHRWLPDGEKNGIILNTHDSNAILKIWFERFGYPSEGSIKFDSKRRELDDSTIEKYGILEGGPLLGSLEISGIKEEDLESMKENKIGDLSYIKIGKRILRILYPAINNFLDIVSIKYGQYWLRGIAPWDPKRASLGSYLHSMKLEWSLDDGKTWTEFIPTELSICFNSIIPSDFRDYLSKMDWNELSTVVKNGWVPSLAANTLGQAYHYLDQDDLKHAIIEGYTAAELSAKEFYHSRLKNNPSLVKEMQGFWNMSLPAQIISIASVLGLPSKDVENAVDSIRMRNAISHSGWNPGMDAKIKLRSLLKIVSIMILGHQFRFPKVNSGNAVMSPPQWEKHYEKYYK